MLWEGCSYSSALQLQQRDEMASGVKMVIWRSFFDLPRDWNS